MKAFDSAWQLLKYAAYHEDDDYDDDDDVDPRKNPGYNEEDLMLDDMDDAILEHEIRQLRQSPGFYDKPEPAVTEEERKEEELKQHIAGYLQSQKLASQPMDLAWRLVKTRVNVPYSRAPTMKEIYERSGNVYQGMSQEEADAYNTTMSQRSEAIEGTQQQQQQLQNYREAERAEEEELRRKRAEEAKAMRDKINEKQAIDSAIQEQERDVFSLFRNEITPKQWNKFKGADYTMAGNLYNDYLRRRGFTHKSKFMDLAWQMLRINNTK
mgnify:CR=1 FL=1